MPKLERAILILGLTALTARGLAAQDCAALASELKSLEAANSRLAASLAADQLPTSDAYRKAEARLQALVGTKGQGDLVASLMNEEEYSTAGMRKFKELNQLPASLDLVITRERPEAFWSAAIVELKHRMERRNERYGDEAAPIEGRILVIIARRKTLDCDRTGPLQFQRNSAGLPVITDALLTRWFRGYRAMQNGGAYWQASQMGQQDFDEVNRRVGSYTIAACKPEGAAMADGSREWVCRTDPVRATLEAGFTSVELGVFDARRSDMEAALSGNWSAVRM